MEPIVYVRFQGGNVKESVDTIDQWGGERSLQPSKVAVQSFDFKQPTFPLYSEQATNRVQGAVLQTEVYEYTGALAFNSTEGGNDLATLRLEEFEAKAKSFSGAEAATRVLIFRTSVVDDYSVRSPTEGVVEGKLLQGRIKFATA